MYNMYKFIRKLVRKLVYSLPISENQRASLVKNFSYIVSKYVAKNPSLPNPIVFNYGKLLFRNNDSGDLGIAKKIFFDGLYEEEVVHLLLEELGEGAIFIDGGAHIGYFTLIASQLVGNTGKVLSFEPCPANFEILKKNVILNNLKNVELHNKAIGETTGKMKFIFPENSSVSVKVVFGALREKNFSGKIFEAEVVDIRDVIRNVLTKVKAPRFIFLKLDIEGFESYVLKAITTLNVPVRLKFVFELNYNNLKNMGFTIDEFLSPLLSMGINEFAVLLPHKKIKISFDSQKDWKLLLSLCKERNLNIFAQTIHS